MQLTKFLLYSRDRQMTCVWAAYLGYPTLVKTKKVSLMCPTLEEEESVPGANGDIGSKGQKDKVRRMKEIEGGERV